MKHSKRTKLIAFAPALVAIGVTALTASGLSVISGATAATSVGVTGNVSSSFSTTPTSTGGSGVTGCADESIASFDTSFAASNGCRVGFSSNNGTGSELTFENANTGAGQSEAFFCSDGVDGPGGSRDCSLNANRIEDAGSSPSTIASSSDSFGIARRALGGDGGTAAGSDVAAADATPTGADSIWVGVPANGAPAQLCHIAGPSTSGSTCDFVFGGAGAGAAQGAGDYSGTMTLTAALT